MCCLLDGLAGVEAKQHFFVLVLQMDSQSEEAELEGSSLAVSKVATCFARFCMHAAFQETFSSRMSVVGASAGRSGASGV